MPDVTDLKVLPGRGTWDAEPARARTFLPDLIPHKIV